MTAPEGRAREYEWSGRPHRLRAAALRHCPFEGRGGRRQRTAGETRTAAHPAGQQPASQPEDFGPTEGEQLQPRSVATVGLALPSLQQWRAARSPGPSRGVLRYAAWRDADAKCNGPRTNARRVGRCPARTCSPQGVHASSGRCGPRTETLPATRRTLRSAAGCNRPALRVWSKPPKS